MALSNGKFGFRFVMLLSVFYACIGSSLAFALDLPEVDLENYEKRVYSQNGEDGVVEKIFELIGTTSGYYVEFGVGDGAECNTRYFRECYGWKGLMMDSGCPDSSINLHQERITAENIVSLFQKYQVPTEFDLLSIDIDSNDFYAWNALSQHYRPRVVVMEYNGAHLPHEDKVIIYHPDNRWDGTNYFGASILAYYKLGRKYGYSLVYAENRGVNIFFIRDDVLENCGVTFRDTNCVEKIFKYPRNVGNGPNGGNLPDPYERGYVKAEDLLK